MVNRNERIKPDGDMIVIATAYDKTCGPQIIDMAKVPFSTDGDKTSYLDWLNESQTFAVASRNGGEEIRTVTVRVSDDPRRGPLISLGNNTVELVSYKGNLLARREPWEEAEGSLQKWIRAERQRRLEVSRADGSGSKRRVSKEGLSNPFDIFGYHQYIKIGRYLDYSLNSISPAKFRIRAGKINFVLPSSPKP